MAVTREEVDYAFRMILGRAPESDAAVDFHVSKFADLKSLRTHLFNTAEFRKAFWQRLAEGDPDIGKKESHFASEKTVFLHIPKNAGTTMNRLLDQLFVESEVFPHQSLISHYPAYFIAKHRLFRGHYTLQEIQYIPGPKVILTLLRDPRMRILSQYHYHKSVKISETAINDLPMVHKARMPLREYLQDETVRQHVSVDNMQTRYLFYLTPSASKRLGVKGPRAGHSFDSLPRKVAVEIAKENLQKIDFVGLVEEFDKFVQLFWAERGISTPLDYKPQNVTRDLARVDPKSHAQVAFEQIDEEVHHLLDDLVELDEDLYRFGASLFRSRFQDWRDRAPLPVAQDAASARQPVLARVTNGSAHPEPSIAPRMRPSPVRPSQIIGRPAQPARTPARTPTPDGSTGQLATRSGGLLTNSPGSASNASPVPAANGVNNGPRRPAKPNGHGETAVVTQPLAAGSASSKPAPSDVPDRRTPTRARRGDRKVPVTTDH